MMNHIKEKFSEASRRAPRRMREIGKQLFEDIRRQAEAIINPKINSEIDLRLKYKFDWQMNECLGTSRSVLSLGDLGSTSFDPFMNFDTNRSHSLTVN